MNKTSNSSCVFTNSLATSRIPTQELLSRSLLLFSIAVGGLGVLGIAPCHAQRRSSYNVANGRMTLVDSQHRITNGKEIVAVWQNISSRYRPLTRSRQTNTRRGGTRTRLPEINTYVSKLIGRSSSFACLTWFCAQEDVSAIQQKAQQFGRESGMGTLHNLVINACIPVSQATPMNPQRPPKSLDIGIVSRKRIRKQDLIKKLGEPQKVNTTRFNRKGEPDISWLVYDYVAFAVDNQANRVVKVSIYCLEYLNTLAVNKPVQ